jgi:hypothetical protein
VQASQGEEVLLLFCSKIYRFFKVFLPMGSQLTSQTLCLILFNTNENVYYIASLAIVQIKPHGNLGEQVQPGQVDFIQNTQPGQTELRQTCVCFRFAKILLCTHIPFVSTIIANENIKLQNRTQKKADTELQLFNDFYFTEGKYNTELFNDFLFSMQLQL